MHIPNGHIIDQYLGLDCLRKKPNVARWWAEISSRPSWEAVKKIAAEAEDGMGLPPRKEINLGSIPFEIRQ